MLDNTQYSIIVNKGKDLKISKNRFNMYGRQVGSRTNEKKCIGNLDSETIRYRTPWMWDFTCPTFWKFEIFGQVGCRTCDTAHVNGCIDAGKCTEIFKNNLHSRVSQG